MKKHILTLSVVWLVISLVVGVLIAVVPGNSIKSDNVVVKKSKITTKTDAPVNSKASGAQGAVGNEGGEIKAKVEVLPAQYKGKIQPQTVVPGGKGEIQLETTVE